MLKITSFRPLLRDYRLAVYFAVGAVFGLVAWSEHSSPSVALLMPVVVALATRRADAFVLALAYHLCTIRFLPPFAGRWFDSLAFGFSCWALAGVAAAASWIVFWPREKSPLRIAAMCGLSLVITAIPPIAMVLQGHPLLAMGYLLPGTSWIGVIGFFVGIPVLAGGIRWLELRHWPLAPVNTVLCLVILFCGLGVSGDKLRAEDIEQAKVAGRVGAINTKFGRFPTSDDEVVTRIEKMNLATRVIAQAGSDSFDTLVFPEEVLGTFEPGNYAVLNATVLRTAKKSNKTVVMGAAVLVGKNQAQKVAIAFYPDGSTSYVAARQPVPVAEWRPRFAGMSYAVDWSSSSVLHVGAGIRARVMFCYEEYIPMLHLLSEATEPHTMMVVMANRWASSNPLTSVVQHGSAQGMAKLFGRKWVVSENT